MLSVLEAKVDPSKTRIGTVVIGYYNLVLQCDLCLYKNEHLYVRLPEWRILPEEKRRLAFFPTKDVSDTFQEKILGMVQDMLEITVDKAIAIKKDYFDRRKELTKQKNKLTLS